MSLSFGGIPWEGDDMEEESVTLAQLAQGCLVAFVTIFGIALGVLALAWLVGGS